MAEGGVEHFRERKIFNEGIGNSHGHAGSTASNRVDRNMSTMPMYARVCAAGNGFARHQSLPVQLLVWHCRRLQSRCHMQRVVYDFFVKCAV